MLGEIAKDMRYFLFLQTGTVLFTAFAFRLLNPEADEFHDVGTAVFTTYALLMFADGVGEREIYKGACTPSQTRPNTLPPWPGLHRSVLRDAIPSSGRHARRVNPHAQRPDRHHG